MDKQFANPLRKNIPKSPENELEKMVKNELRFYGLTNVKLEKTEGGHSALAYYKVTTRDGEIYFCKVIEIAKNPHLKSVLDVIFRVLEQHKYPTIYPIKDDEQQFLHLIPDTENALVVSPFVEMKKAQEIPENYFKMGDLLRQLHAIEVENPELMNIQSGLSLEHTAMQIEKLKNKIDQGNREATLTEQGLLDYYNQILKEIGSNIDNLPKRILHGDIKPENTATNTNGQIAGFIDFDIAGYGIRLCDIAMAIAMIFANKSIVRPAEASKQFFKGYQNGETKLTKLELKLLPRFIQMACINAALWWMLDYRGDDGLDKILERLRICKAFEDLNI